MKGVVTALLVLASLAVSDAARALNLNHGMDVGLSIGLMGPSSERPGSVGPAGGKPGGRPRQCIPQYISLDHYHQEPKTSIKTDTITYQRVVDVCNF